MKKTVLFCGKLLALALALLTLAMPAFADVIYEPSDGFYEAHRKECVYENATYETCGPNGEVILYASPEKNKEKGRIPNGECIWISYVYEDKQGIRWGIVEQYKNGKNTSGWLPMDYLWENYSSKLFRQDYADAITEENFTVNEDGTAANVTFWSYPGGRDNQVYSAGEGFTPGGSLIFTDEQGRKWGYVGYYMGIRGYWILLEDPGATFEEIFPDGAPIRDLRTPPEGDVEEIVPGGKKDSNADDKNEQEKEQKPEKNDREEDPEEETDSNSGNRALLFCSAAVALVVAVTAVLLVVLKKKRASTKETE